LLIIDKKIIIFRMIQYLRVFLGLNLSFVSFVSAQEVLPEDLGTDTYSVRYREAFETLDRFRGTSSSIQVYENRLSLLQRALESLKAQLRSFIAGFGGNNEVLAPPPIEPQAPISLVDCSAPDINPANLQRDETLTVYQNDSGGKQWPVNNDTFHITVKTGEYLALEFTTPSDSEPYGDFMGSVSFITTNKGPLTSGYTYSVSVCPGDFSPDLGRCFHSREELSTFSWTTNEDVTARYNGCRLQDDTTYYFNYINAHNEPNLDVSDCPAAPGGSCGKFIVNNSGVSF
jgi:hypothetical protein